MKRDDCWYRKACSLDECSSCIRYIEMKALMEHSNIPISRQKPVGLVPDLVDYDAFCELADYKDNVVTHVEQGTNLYIWSKVTGNGKTTWAIKILLKYFDSVWAGNGLKCRGVFINVPTFLTKLKNFKDEDEDFEALKKHLMTCDLVVWDDIASVDMSNYDHAQLLTYIDQRVLNEKANIFTGNLGGNDVTNAIGVRLASRVWNGSYVIELKGGDKRNGSITNH